MIEIFGAVVGATVLLAACLARRLRKHHKPRALQLAEASEKEADRVARHAEGERMWGPHAGDDESGYRCPQTGMTYVTRCCERAEPYARRIRSETPYASVLEHGGMSIQERRQRLFAGKGIQSQADWDRAWKELERYWWKE